MPSFHSSITHSRNLGVGCYAQQQPGCCPPAVINVDCGGGSGAHGATGAQGDQGATGAQ